MRANPSSRRIAGTAGFTLLETVSALLISGLLMLSTIKFFSAISSQINHPVITFQGPTETAPNNYTLAPVMNGVNDGINKTDIMDAMRLHMVFSRQIAAADFVAVFGGANIDAGAPAALMPLNMSFSSQTIPSLALKQPRDLLTTQQIAAAAPEISSQYDASAGPNDFTVLTFQGLDQVTTIAQVRRYTTTWNGKPQALYATTMYARVLPSTTWTTYACYFFLPVAEDVWAVPVGATHYWFRYETTWWARQEPTGSALVFPDPYVLAVTAADSAVKPMSRFAYFVTASP